MLDNHFEVLVSIMCYSLFSSLLGISLGLATAQQIQPREWTTWGINAGQWSEVVTRDVCIIGGGGSGAHAAVLLKDRNKTVAIVERNYRLGGHAETYIDPVSQTPVDLGVTIHQPIPEVLSFFQRFGVDLLNMATMEWNQPGQPANKSLPSLGYRTIPKYSDFRSGVAVQRQQADPTAAFNRAAGVLFRYICLLRGCSDFNPVPEDLYIPFGAFIEKYGLGDVVPTWYVYTQGMGDLLHMPTVYAIKYFNLDDIKALTQGHLTAARGDTAELYSRVAEYIGKSNLFLQSTVITSNRRNETTTTGRRELLISTPESGLILLSCNQVLLTVPPTFDNLDGWDLSSEEHDVFSQLSGANGYWTGLVTNVGLNQSFTYWNAAANTPFNIPVLPALYALTPTGVLDDVWMLKFSADTPALTDDQVRDYIRAEIRRLQHANCVSCTEIEFLILISHSPFMLHASSDKIREGFLGRLSALQGGFGGSMFYSGAAFHTHYSSLLWRFNEEVVIPMMMAASTWRI